MKRIAILPAACIAALLFSAAPALAQEAGCAKKERVLEQKIALAKSRGNTRQVAGLEEALGKVRRYCTDSSLRAKAEMDVAEQRQEVLEREADLEEARAKGDAKKIAKRERKLEEARRELTAAESKRDALPN